MTGDALSPAVPSRHRHVTGETTCRTRFCRAIYRMHPKLGFFANYYRRPSAKLGTTASLPFTGGHADR